MFWAVTTAFVCINAQASDGGTNLVNYPVFLDKEVDLGLVKAFQSKDNTNQFYYLPSYVRLKRDPITDAVMVGFQQYVQNIKSAADDEETKDKGAGGGFFWMTVGFALTQEELQECQQRLQQLRPGAALVGSMSYESGNCSLITFGVEKDGDGNSSTQILGVGKAPLMEGDAIAVGIVLNAENATKLYATLRLPNPNVQMNFDMNFRGFSSPIKAKIEMNYDRIANDKRMSGALQIPKLGFEIEKLTQEFKDNGAIKISIEGDLSDTDEALIKEMNDLFKLHFFEEVDNTNAIFQNQSEGESPMQKLNTYKESYNGSKQLMEDEVLLQKHLNNYINISKIILKEKAENHLNSLKLNYFFIDKIDKDFVLKLISFPSFKKTFSSADRIESFIEDKALGFAKQTESNAKSFKDTLAIGYQLFISSIHYCLASQKYTILNERLNYLQKSLEQLNFIIANLDYVKTKEFKALMVEVKEVKSIIEDQIIKEKNTPIRSKSREILLNLAKLMDSNTFRDSLNIVNAPNYTTEERAEFNSEFKISFDVLGKEQERGAELMNKLYEKSSLGAYLYNSSIMFIYSIFTHEEEPIEKLEAISQKATGNLNTYINSPQLHKPKDYKSVASIILESFQKYFDELKKEKKAPNYSSKKLDIADIYNIKGIIILSDDDQVSARTINGEPLNSKPDLSDRSSAIIDLLANDSTNGSSKTPAVENLPPTNKMNPTNPTDKKPEKSIVEVINSIPVSAYLGYKIKNIKSSGVKTFDLNRIRSAKRDRAIVFNLPKIPSANIQQINLDDPLYAQREIMAILDGDIVSNFSKYINYVNISVRKRHPEGHISTPEQVVDRNNFDKYGNRFKLLYGWRPGDNDRRTWLDYEYRTIWSYHGGGEITNEWSESNKAAISLTSPCKLMDIKIWGDIEILKELGVRLVQVKLFSTIGSVQRSEVKSFNVNRLQNLEDVIQIILPNNVTEYQYQIIWTLTGSRTIKTELFTTETTELLVDELPN